MVDFSGTVNISNGAPLWNGTVIYPMPILSQPLNHGPQSISGSLNMTGYNIVNVGRIGIGTTTPAFELDDLGFVNSYKGYLYQGNSEASDNAWYRTGPHLFPEAAESRQQPTTSTCVEGTICTQQPFLNFDGNFHVLDNPGSTRTEVGLQRRPA